LKAKSFILYNVYIGGRYAVSPVFIRATFGRKGTPLMRNIQTDAFEWDRF